MDKNLKSMATMHRMQVTGLNLFYKKGYYNTSVDDILKELSLSKGAFYHHFRSKEDFFVSIIQNLIMRKVYNMLIEPIEAKEDPLKAIIMSFENALNTAEHNQFDGGFILSNFMTEFSGKNEMISRYLRDIYKTWEVNLVTILQKGKTDGYISRHADSEAAANYLISSYMGVRLLMVEGNSKMLSYQYLQQTKVYLKSLEQRMVA